MSAARNLPARRLTRGVWRRRDATITTDANPPWVVAFGQHATWRSSMTSLERAKLPGAFIGGLLIFLVGCGQDVKPQSTQPVASGETQADRPVLEVGQGPEELPGLANVCRVSEKLL